MRSDQPHMHAVTFADFSGTGPIRYGRASPAGVMWVCRECEPRARAPSDLTLGRAWVALGRAERAQDDLPAPFNRPGPAMLRDMPIDVGVQDGCCLDVSLGRLIISLCLNRAAARVSVSMDEETVLLDGRPTQDGGTVQWHLVHVPNTRHSRTCNACFPEAEDARFDTVAADDQLVEQVVFLARLPLARLDDKGDRPGWAAWYMPAEGVWLWRGLTDDSGLALVERVTEHETADLEVLERVGVALPKDPRPSATGPET